jgi:peroxiredoxin
MSLEQDLLDFRAQFERTAPSERVALYNEKVEELKRTFVREAVPSMGDRAPDFELLDASGQALGLSGLLEAGPVILVFYRGGWCPYCNLQLRAYQRVLPQITALGGRLVAVSPQLPDRSLATLQDNELEFDVLSDIGNGVASRYGLTYILPVELQAVLEKVGKALPSINGDDSWELAVPAVFVIGTDGLIALSAVDIDYRSRPSPELILSTLRSLR